ncbi:unnamed protein product, partial [marine sediment metagenome]
GYIKLSHKEKVVSRISYVFRKPIVDINKNIDSCDTTHVDPDERTTASDTDWYVSKEV